MKEGSIALILFDIVTVRTKDVNWKLAGFANVLFVMIAVFHQFFYFLVLL